MCITRNNCQEIYNGARRRPSVLQEKILNWISLPQSLFQLHITCNHTLKVTGISYIVSYFSELTLLIVSRIIKLQHNEGLHSSAIQVWHHIHVSSWSLFCLLFWYDVSLQKYIWLCSFVHILMLQYSGVQGGPTGEWPLPCPHVHCHGDPLSSAEEPTSVACATWGRLTTNCIYSVVRLSAWLLNKCTGTQCVQRCVFVVFCLVPSEGEQIKCVTKIWAIKYKH